MDIVYMDQLTPKNNSLLVLEFIAMIIYYTPTQVLMYQQHEFNKLNLTPSHLAL